MKQIAFLMVAFAAVAGVIAFAALASEETGGEAAPIFGIKIPDGYRDWRLISVEENFSHTGRKGHKEGHSSSPGSGAFGLDGRSTCLTRQAEEDFHTEVAKITKRATPNSPVSGAIDLDGSIALFWPRWTIDALVRYSRSAL
jgi:hypothetical protein